MADREDMGAGEATREVDADDEVDIDSGEGWENVLCCGCEGCGGWKPSWRERLGREGPGVGFGCWEDCDWERDSDMESGGGAGEKGRV